MQPPKRPELDKQGQLGDRTRRNLGIDAETLQQFFLMHRHDGSPMGCQPANRLVLADTVTGDLYEIQVISGVLTATAI